jgi:hypothetical protein
MAFDLTHALYVTQVVGALQMVTLPGAVFPAVVTVKPATDQLIPCL